MSGSQAAFQRLVEEALGLIPEAFRPYLENVEILVEEEPEEELLDRLGIHEGHVLYGIYQGVPLTQRGHDPGWPPDRIRLFRRPLLEDYPDPEALRREVAVTVLHEIAHHFGIGEERLRELGWD